MTPTNVLSLKLQTDAAATVIQFPVRRVINAGYAGRNRHAVQAHIDELAREGVAPPATIPAFYALTADTVTTARQIEVVGEQTSGEVEFVLLLHAGEMYVGVGSDHTDRALERHDVLRSKQICKNILSQEVWRYRDVERRWDDLVLRSWVSPETGGEALYQEGALARLLPPQSLLDQAGLVPGGSDWMVLYFIRARSR